MEDIGAKLQVLTVNLERLGGEQVNAVQDFHNQWQDFVRAVHLAATVGEIQPQQSPQTNGQANRQQQQEQEEAHGTSAEREKKKGPQEAASASSSTPQQSTPATSTEKTTATPD